MPSKASRSPRPKGAKRPLCNRCAKRIHVPAGWSPQSATRKHYWRHHPEVMLRSRGGDER